MLKFENRMITMTYMNPFFTIGVMTYDRPILLRKCLLSIKHQSFKDFEVIIGNDYISAEVILADHGIEDTRFIVINNQKNLGEADNMNMLLNAAKGNYFIWLADDDLMHPHLLAMSHESLQTQSSKKPIAVFSNYSSGEQPNEKFFQRRQAYNIGSLYQQQEFLQKYLSRQIDLIGCYGLIPTKELRRIGGIKRLGNDFGPFSDTILPIMLAEHCNILYLDVPLIFLRLHPESKSTTSTNMSAYTSAENDFLSVFSKYCERNSCIQGVRLLKYFIVKWFAETESIVYFRSGISSKVSFFLQVRRQIYLLRETGNTYRLIGHLMFLVGLYCKYTVKRLYRQITLDGKN